jgi:hypothetical protein
MPIRNPEIVKQFLARQDRVGRDNGAIPLGPDIRSYRDQVTPLIRVGDAIPLGAGQNTPQIRLNNIPEGLSLSDIEQGVAAILAKEAYGLARWEIRRGIKMEPFEERFMNKIDQSLPENYHHPSYFEAVLDQARTAWIEHFK